MNLKLWNQVQTQEAILTMKTNFDVEIPEITQFYGDYATFAPEEITDPKKRVFRTIAASDKPTGDFRRILPIGLPIVASDLGKSQPLMINHSTYSKDSMPVGRTITGKYIKARQIVEADFYLDNEPHNERLLAGIDNGTIRDVSIGASGKFTCSIDQSRMGFFGCYAKGHYRGQEVLLDKNGNETDQVSEAVSTVYVYADFTVKSVDELSLAWKGAVKDASITKKYSADPHQDQEIRNVVKSLYERKEIDDYDLQRLTASYGGVQSILDHGKASPKIFLPVSHKKEEVMSTDLAPEVQARITELESGKTELETQLQAALDKVKELEENGISEEDFQTASDEANTKISQLETEVADLKKDEEQLKLKSELYDKLVLKLRTDLKAAKRTAGASDDELSTFNEQVDTMMDASNMLTLLGEISGKKSTTKSFMRVIEAKKTEDVNNEQFSQEERARIMSAY